MPVLALQGLRGGCGATALSAALGWALNALQQSVLLIDLSPANQLAAHFNLPLDTPHGWLCAQLDRQPWLHSALRYQPGLDFLPSGTLTHQQTLSLNAATAEIAHRCLRLCRP
ncbi:hypothetical protein E05_21020 [Plautia stali symbiont]|nr:hypothetical protein E05_21020 [Plautia stali symbiont]